jgi:small subunit ribosomal protein S5
MAEMLDESSALESTTVGVYRTAATIKGGRRFSFSSLVVVGDRGGRVGVGYGKANQVPPAIEKAQKDAKRRLKRYPLVGRTIPHQVTGCYGSCRVRLVPASPGTGVIAGAAVRAPLEMLGVQDCLTKSFGSNNGKNLVKAVIDGLEKLRSRQQVQRMRGVELADTTVEEAIERSRSKVPGAEEEQAAETAQAAPAPETARDAPPTPAPERASTPRTAPAPETTTVPESAPATGTAPPPGAGETAPPPADRGEGGS